MKLNAIILCLLLPAALAGGQKKWGPYRGANTRPTITEQDVQEFAALGGNLLRINGNTRPLMKKQPPYDFDEDNFTLLDHMLDYCQKYGVHVVIDPHTTPGTEMPTTTRPTDKLWSDFTYQHYLINLWEKIAARYKDRGDVIAGYDLLNEPSLPNGGAAGTPADWNLLVRKLIKVIRAADKTHTIIIEPPTIRTPEGKVLTRLQGMAYLEAPADANVVYSPHMYEPHEFTHQGVQGRLEGVAYPSVIRGTRWDREAMEKAFEPVAEFQRKHNVPIFMGEFSAPRWVGEDGNRYVRDIIESCEKNGWSWAYHSYREADVWNAEMSNSDKQDRNRRASTPRLDLLKSFFKLNGK
jgi:endoglucanase